MIDAFCFVIVSQNVCRSSHTNIVVKFEGTVTKQERQVHDLQVLHVTCPRCELVTDSLSVRVSS